MNEKRDPDPGVCADCDHPMSAHDDGACGEIGCDCSSYCAASASAPELRYAITSLTDIDVRDPSGNSDGSWTMSGYAAVFNESTTLYDGKFIKLTESIDPGAFDRCLREQGIGTAAGVVHFNPSHDMSRAVAATDVQAGEIGSLILQPDNKGLFYLARTSKDDPDAVAMASKMRIGVLRQASFAFTIAKSEITETETDDGPDESHRRILEIGHLYDVCATPQGAYSQTVSQLRSYAAAIGQPTTFRTELLGVGDWPEATSRQPDLGGELVSRASGGGADRRRALAQMMRDSHSLQRM